MNDTDPKIETRIRTMIQQKSGSERFLMGCSMYETAKLLVLSSIRAKYPHISPGQLKYEILLRFYMEDFDSEQLQKLKKYLIQYDNLT